MKYLPFENFILTTNLSVEEVRNRLTNNIEPRKSSFISASSTISSKPYEGSIFNNSFKISRIISYRNSFLPVITGDISQAWGKTEIGIQMKPVLFVLIFKDRFYYSNEFTGKIDYCEFTTPTTHNYYKLDTLIPGRLRSDRVYPM